MPNKGHRFHILVWLATTLLDIADTAHARHLCPAALESKAPDGTLFVLFRSPQARLALEHGTTCQRAPVYPTLSSFPFLTVCQFHLYPSLTTTETNTEDYRTWSFQCILTMQKADFSYSSLIGLFERLCDNMNPSLSSCLTSVLSVSAHIHSRYAGIPGKHISLSPPPLLQLYSVCLAFGNEHPDGRVTYLSPLQ